MKYYADTSVFFSLYVTDANSAKADAWRLANPQPLPFSGFHRLELRNALSLAVHQRRLSPAQALAAWSQVQIDIGSGLLVETQDVWSRLTVEAEKLAVLHTPALGTRSLDILHVAGALVLSATEFCTFDIRQGRLAQLSGLRLVTL